MRILPSRRSRPSRAGARPRRLALVVSLLVVGALAAGACAPDSTNVPNAREVPGALISVDGTTGGAGTMGVDIMLGSGEYNPCHLQTSPADPNFQYNDPFYGACQDSSIGRTSYYRAVGYSAGGTQFSNGVAFGNSDPNLCKGATWCPRQDPTLVHDWAKKATAWALEFYPNDSNEGGVRVQGRFDATTIDGRSWSGSVGVIRPPRADQPNMFKLWGWVTGGPWPNDRFEVQAFQVPPFSMTTTGGWPEQGFSLGRVFGGGIYGLGALPAGNYKLYVWDNATGEHYITYRTLGPGAQLDIRPGLPCFGLRPALDANEAPAC